LNGTWPVNQTENRICGGSFKCYINETCGSNIWYKKNSTSFIDGNIYKDTNSKDFYYGFVNFNDIFSALTTVF